MSFAEANCKAFDRWATSMDNQPWFQDLMLQITTALRCRLAFIGIENPVSAGTKLLDYACGTGLVSSALLNHFTTIRGIDISPQIVRVYNSRFLACGIPASRIHSVVGNLVSEDRKPCPGFDEDSGEWTDFDTVIAGFSFRHLDNAGLAAERLVERLRPGGVLCVFDLLEQDRRMSNDRQKTKPLHDLDVIKVHGFSKDDIRSILECAGLVDVDVDILDEELVVNNSGVRKPRQCFFARGRRN